MNLLNRNILLLSLLFVGLVIAGAGAASAQDVYKVNYFSNNVPVVPVVAGVKPLVAVAPDGTVRITNPGLTYANLCAMIYVFDQDQQLSECCGCTETHNGLRTLSIHSDLTSNPLTGVVSNNGIVKVISSAPVGGVCDPTSTFTGKPNLRVWVTHVQGPAGPITETESSDSTLGATELANLQAQCSFIAVLGSGQGFCSCGTGD